MYVFQFIVTMYNIFLFIYVFAITPHLFISHSICSLCYMEKVCNSYDCV